MTTFQENKQDLIEMGFSAEDAERALLIYPHSTSDAVDYLVSGAQPPIDDPPALIEAPETVPRTLPSTDHAVEHSFGTQQSQLGPYAPASMTDVPTQPQEAAPASRTQVPAITSSTVAKPTATTPSTLQSYAQVTNPSKPVYGSSYLTRDDEDLSRAIMASLVDSPQQEYDTFDDPHDRMRKPGIPVGLKNIGNTCYFASLIQTYYHIPAVRRAVLAYEGTVAETSTDKENDAPPSEDALRRKEHNARFLSELQRVFALLLLSEQSYIDPKALVAAIVDDTGKRLEMNAQQDVGEFHLHLLERIVEGLYPDAEDRDTRRMSTMSLGVPTSPQRKGYLSGSLDPRRDPITRVFHGTQVEELVYEREQGGGDEPLVHGHGLNALLEPPGSTNTQNRSGFGSLILNVTKGDLYSALDEYVGPTNVDFVPEDGNGEAVVARKEVVFESMPPVLMIQLQRVQYDAERKNAYKITTAFEFGQTCDMQRYHESSRKEYRRRRELVDGLSEERCGLEERLAVHENYKGREIPVDGALQSSIDYLHENREGLDESAIEEATLLLRRCFDRVSGDMGDLREQISVNQAKVAAMYGDMRGMPYRVHSVLVHEGSAASSGHYWAYIHDPATEQWGRFNDQHVTCEDAETVFGKSIGGGDGSASAYCVIYVADEQEDGVLVEPPETDPPILAPESDLVSLIPPSVLEFVQQENAKFQDEIKNWASLQAQMLVKKQAEQFHSRFWESYSSLTKMARAVKNQENGKLLVRLHSFIYFLIFMEDFRLVNCAKFLLCDQLFRAENDGKGIEDLRDEELTRAIEAEFAPYPAAGNTVFIMANCVVLRKIYDAWFTMWAWVIEAAEYAVAGMEAMLATDHRAALVFLCSAVMAHNTREERYREIEGQASFHDTLAIQAGVGLLQYSSALRLALQNAPDMDSRLDLLGDILLLADAINLMRYHKTAVAVSLAVKEEWLIIVDDVYKSLDDDTAEYVQPSFTVLQTKLGAQLADTGLENRFLSESVPIPHRTTNPTIARSIGWTEAQTDAEFKAANPGMLNFDPGFVPSDGLAGQPLAELMMEESPEFMGRFRDALTRCRDAFADDIELVTKIKAEFNRKRTGHHTSSYTGAGWGYYGM